MTVRLRVNERFARSSWVGRYWLTRCEGFRVAGAAEGRVSEVLADADPRLPTALVVRGGWRRRPRTLPISAVSVVVPAEHLIVVARGNAEPRRRATGRAATSAMTRAIAGAAAAAARRGPAARRIVRAVAREALFLAGTVIALLARVVVAVVVATARTAAVRATSAADANTRRRSRAARTRRASGRRQPTV
jgi:hypothetical protein